jgi:hypothetical protein
MIIDYLSIINDYLGVDTTLELLLALVVIVLGFIFFKLK